MKSHVNSICKSANLALHNIGKIRKYLDASTTEKLIHAFVSSKLDQYNSLLYGLPAYQIKKLQLIQNKAARIVTKTRPREHITPVLKRLHWLPVEARIQFKLLLLIYKAVNGKAPQYIQTLLQPQETRNLRSSKKQFLKQPRSLTRSFGDRAFCTAGPALWNNLPLSVRTEKSLDIFKYKLKAII